MVRAAWKRKDAKYDSVLMTLRAWPLAIAVGVVLAVCAGPNLLVNVFSTTSFAVILFRFLRPRRIGSFAEQRHRMERYSW